MPPIRRDKLVKRKPSTFNYVQKKMAKENGGTPTTPRILSAQIEGNSDSPGTIFEFSISKYLNIF
jgi:hypothetical protein